MIDRNEILKDLIYELDKYKFPRKITIGPSTELYHDLGMHGIDFMEILMRMEKKFDTTVDYNAISRYCLPDSSIFFAIINMFRAIAGKKQKLESLKVSDLVDAIQVGRWPAYDCTDEYSK